MRHFTLPEAQALLPEVERLLRKAVRMKEAHQAAEEEAQRMQRQVEMMGGMRIDAARAVALRKQKDDSAEGLKEAVESIQEIGVQVKDLDVGLVDFPTWFRGEEVLLCWRLGEKGIAYWHGMTEGFRGRKAIDREFLDHHSGDDAN
jgi:hypothetical protein